jgi:hypothetical protein
MVTLSITCSRSAETTEYVTWEFPDHDVIVALYDVATESTITYTVPERFAVAAATPESLDSDSSIEAALAPAYLVPVTITQRFNVGGPPDRVADVFLWFQPGAAGAVLCMDARTITEAHDSPDPLRANVSLRAAAAGSRPVQLQAAALNAGQVLLEDASISASGDLTMHVSGVPLTRSDVGLAAALEAALAASVSPAPRTRLPAALIVLFSALGAGLLLLLGLALLFG